MDTIFAVASAPGKSGVAVFRLSGPSAHAAVMALCGALPPVRQASLRKLTWGGEVIDEGIVLVFAEGASFTGEASAELQVHGSVAVTRSLMRALSGFPGLRQAEAGEFTRRALQNGRLDLTQVEGLADLIDAETDAQRRQAMRVLEGAIGRRTQLWRAKLIRAAALNEATIDFADEDVPSDVFPEVLGLVDDLLGALRLEIAGAQVAERVRDGFEVAIIGVPNSGKSTLFNALAGRDAAITSEIPGTTRDVIEVRMDLGGLPVTFLDTAGLRATTDPVERIGVDRALARARAADLRVFLLAGHADDLPLSPLAEDIVVLGKSDLRVWDGASVSGLTGQGLDGLTARVAAILAGRVALTGVMTRERHRVAILRAVAALESARDEIKRSGSRPELVAADLWVAIQALDVLVGRVNVETLLDEIFASFCIGK